MRITRLFFFSLLLLAVVLPGFLLAEDSQCVKCHTSARSLIAATREIAAEVGNLITESPESVGEG